MLMSIEIGSAGYNHKHEKEFHAELPGGPGACLFLLVKSPALFIINGKNYKVSPNTYIMLNANTPCSYRSYRDNYIDDWFYFGLEDSDREFLKNLNIVFDEPVKLSNTENLSQIIHQIAFELFSSNPYHQEIKESLTQVFFYQLARIISSKQIVSPDLYATKNEKLTYLRTQLFQYPAAFSNVDEMADFMNLSRSGFQHLYFNVFGNSVIKDVIAGRISLAKELLKDNKLTIAEIGVKCGYKTEYHFMRQFKQVTGFTPTAFRNSDLWNQINTTNK